MLLCFFGHENALKEIHQYFSFHKKSISETAEVILTDFNEELFEQLSSVFPDDKDRPSPYIVLSPNWINEWLDDFKKQEWEYCAGQEQSFAEAITQLATLLKAKGVKTRLKQWKTNANSYIRKEKEKRAGKPKKIIEEEIKNLPIVRLLDMVNRNEAYLLRSHKYNETYKNFTILNNKLHVFRQMNLSFDIMAAKLMYCEYGSYATTDFLEIFQDEGNYDPVLDTYYRQPLIPIDELGISKAETCHELRAAMLHDPSFDKFNVTSASVFDSSTFDGLDWSLEGTLENLPFGPDDEEELDIESEES